MMRKQKLEIIQNVDRAKSLGLTEARKNRFVNAWILCWCSRGQLKAYLA